MSERGSFVTGYIYCVRCFDIAKKILLGKEKYLCSTTIPHWDTTVPELPIIAGKIGGLYQGEELSTFEFDIIPRLAAELCHKLKIAVLSDSGGGKIFTCFPKRKDKKR